MRSSASSLHVSSTPKMSYAATCMYVIICCSSCLDLKPCMFHEAILRFAIRLCKLGALCTDRVGSYLLPPCSSLSLSASSPFVAIGGPLDHAPIEDGAGTILPFAATRKSLPLGMDLRMV